VSEGGRVRVVGLGNPMAGDDGVGVQAARRLAALPGLEADVVEAGLDGLGMLDWMRGRRAVILIDAVRGGGPPGTIRRLDASAAPLGPPLFPHSTHAFSAADAVELARALGILPPIVIVYGLEIGSAEPGGALSLDVARALPGLVARAAADVAALQRR
jgi:hydrogenase maturation protease